MKLWLKILLAFLLLWPSTADAPAAKENILEKVPLSNLLKEKVRLGAKTGKIVNLKRKVL